MLLPPTGSSGSDRVARTERSLIRLHGAVLVVLGILGLFAANAQGAAPVLVWISAGLWLAVAVDLLARGERPVHLVMLWTALAAGSWAQAEVADGALPAGLAVGVFGLSAARLLITPAFAGAMLLAAGTSIGITAVVQSSALLTTIDDAVLSVAMTVAIRGLLDTVGGASIRLRDADRDLASARRAEARAKAERDAADRAARAMHDEVLTALRGIVAGWPEKTVRRDARSAIEAVREAATPPRALPGPPQVAGQWDAYVREVTENSPVTVDFEFSGDPSRSNLSPGAVDALTRATREALRNAARHGGVDRASLRVAFNCDAIEVRVIDHGTGTVERINPGFGLRASVAEPLAREGGSVRFENTDGGGITAVMELPRQQTERNDRLARAYRATMHASLSQSPVTSLVLPIAAAYSYIAVRNSADWTSPATSLLLLLGFTVVLGLIVKRLRADPPTPRWLFLVSGSLAALTAVGLAAAPDGAMLDFRGWPVGYAAVITSMLLLAVPAPVGIALLAPFPLLVIVAQRLEPSLSGGVPPWSAVNAALMLPLGLLGVGAALRKVGRRVEADHSRAARLWLADAGRHAASWVSRVHLAHTRRHALPWLTAVADGSISVSDPETVAAAGILAMEVRDDLYAPGFLDDDLRSAVNQFRRRGGQVRIRPTATTSSHNAVGNVVRALVDELDSRHRITLSMDRGATSGSGWRIVVVPPIPASLVERVATGRVESDSDRTLVTTGGDAAP